jgi:ParB family chromosome partitioning protein
MLTTISSISVVGRHRRDMGDLQALANSIAEVGLLHPIGVSPDG